MAGRARLAERISTDAPVDDLDVEGEHWDAGRWRRYESFTADGGLTMLGAVAVGPDGEVAGASELYQSVDDPEHLYQGDTIVEREHRGHRLGLRLKVAVLRAAQQRFPAGRIVSTWNAASNEHMIAVNERLGCLVAERCSEWQRSVPALARV